MRWINQSINQSVQLFNQSINQSINQSVNYSFNQSIDQSSDQSNSNYQPLNLSSCNFKIFNRHKFQYHFDAHVTSTQSYKQSIHLTNVLCVCRSFANKWLEVACLSHFPYDSLYQPGNYANTHCSKHHYKLTLTQLW